MSILHPGDLFPAEAWLCLKSDPSCYLIDVRTDQEWRTVGVPDLSSIAKKLVMLSLQENFVKELMSIIPDKNSKLLFICRSGIRSNTAAHNAFKDGYLNSYNILGGFEGEGGWIASNMPWRLY